MFENKKREFVILLTKERKCKSEQNNVNFKTSKMDCRCHSFPLFRLIVGAFQEDCCQFSGLWRLALLPLGRPLIWKIYQTFFHCKQSQNL